MTNCNYSEHTKIQRKEIQKQIEELQAKLEELENPKSPVEIAFKDNYGVYPDELKSNDDFNCWVSFKRGYIAAKQDKKVKQPEEIDWKSVALCFGEELVDVGPDGYYDFTPAQWLEWTKKVYKQVEEPEEGTWNYDPDAKFRKQEEVKKLQQKEWTYKITDEHGETNPYKQYLSSKKPQTLYDCIANWWDEIFMNGNPSGQNIESLVEQIVKLFPDEVNEPSACDDWDIAWNQGFNAYRDVILRKVK